MDQEASELFGSGPRVEGILEFHVTSSADVQDVRIHRRVTSRRQFKISLAPFPDVLAEVSGSDFGSMVHLNPIELGRSVETWREPVPDTRTPKESP